MLPCFGNRQKLENGALPNDTLDLRGGRVVYTLGGQRIPERSHLIDVQQGPAVQSAGTTTQPVASAASRTPTS